MFEIIPKSFHFDFIGRRKFFAWLSLAATLTAAALFFTKGPNWSLDFTGGTEIELHFETPTEIGPLREALAAVGVTEDAIQPVGAPAESRYLVRLKGQASADPADVQRARTALESAFGAAWITAFTLDEEVGTRVSVVYGGDPVDSTRIAEALRTVPGAGIQASHEENQFYLRLPGVAEGVRKVMQGALADRKPVLDRADSVGPKVGDALKTAGLAAVTWSVILHLAYVGMRFELAFAPGAILCLVHDVLIACGIMVITRLDFGLSTVSALLTLTGYSLNDTIVTYDRIRENMHRYRRKNFGDLLNDSINQTLSRTVMTNGATCLALIPFLWWGGPVLQEFAIVMLIGIVIGTYSTIFVAAPLTMILVDNQDMIRGWVGLKPRQT
jgi:preprotein translocase subunit SecF